MDDWSFCVILVAVGFTLMLSVACFLVPLVMAVNVHADYLLLYLLTIPFGVSIIALLAGGA